jgi:hypothetical protein
MTLSAHPFRFAAILIALFSIFSILIGSLTNHAEGQAAHPSADFIALNLKIDGALSCSDAKCHGSTKPEAAPKIAGNEYLTWAKKDAHKRAYTALVSPDVKNKPNLGKLVAWAKGKQINLTTSDRCVTCHALQVPANLQGQKYNVKEGNTCANCHGPSEKWREPHAVEGWTIKERKTAGNSAAFLKTWGLYDTKDIAFRAQKCAACHLAIDAELVDNGHPQPRFELDYYCEFSNFSTPTFATATHWREEAGYHHVALWMGGQVVCVRDAMNQLAERAKGGAPAAALKESMQQAMGHYSVFRQILLTKAMPGDAAALDAQAKKISDALANPDAAKDAIAAAASAIADAAGKMVPDIGGLKPDKDQTLKMLAGIAGDTTIAGFGNFGMEQQAWAIAALYGGYASAEKAQPDVAASIKSKLVDPAKAGTAAADEFAKALAEVKGKLPAP